MNNNLRVDNEFRFSGELTKKKLIQYFPAMLITNISTLLLISVDGLVVGNFCGKSALSSVNIFYPATLAIGIISTILSAGAAARLSEGMGKIDIRGLYKTRSTLKILMIIAALFVAVIQIPIVYIIISSYSLSSEMNSLVWSYAIGIMISLPFGLISTIGVLQLQIVGKMKVLMGLACLEGGANLVLDLLFVGAFDMGVAGAGYGTAGANIIRCTTTLIYLIKKTDMFHTGGEKATLIEAGEILKRGLPDSTNSLMMAIQNYVIMSVVLSAFGEEGGTIRGVCSFAFNVASVVFTSVQGSVRPLSGLFSGAKNYRGLRILVQQGVIAASVLTAIVVVVAEFFPGLFYTVHGVDDIPSGGYLSLRIFVLYLVFKAIDEIFRLYFTNRRIYKFSTTLAIVGNATLPLFAFVFGHVFRAEMIFLSYLCTETIILIANLIRYFKLLHNDKKSRSENETDIYVTVSVNDAVECSRQIRAYANEHNVNKKYAFRTALCVEEMVAYAKATHDSEDVNIQVMIRFLKDSALLMIIDDGACIYLDKEEANERLVTTNYGLLKKVSSSVEYQYVLDMNYTVCRYEG